MFGLFKRKTVLPPDNFLDGYVNKDMYFVRTAYWDWLNDYQITVSTVIDDKPSMLTMDFWLQEIFIQAKGQMTVIELVDFARKEFKANKKDVPDGLSEYIVSELERLVNDRKIVEFRSERTKLDKSFELPMSKQVKE